MFSEMVAKECDIEKSVADGIRWLLSDEMWVVPLQNQIQDEYKYKMQKLLRNAEILWRKETFYCGYYPFFLAHHC